MSDASVPTPARRTRGKAAAEGGAGDPLASLGAEYEDESSMSEGEAQMVAAAKKASTAARGAGGRARDLVLEKIARAAERESARRSKIERNSRADEQPHAPRRANQAASDCATT